MITDLMREMVAFNVTNWLVGLAIKLSAIANIHKYKGLHEWHHFILMAMEVHGASKMWYGSFHQGMYLSFPR
jgi:hypothetical protein